MQITHAPHPFIRRSVKTALAGLLIALISAVLLAGHGFHPTAWAQSTVDYDDDDDGLIDVATLARLNAIRWDLDGDGTVDDSANATAYATAFPSAMTGMGCPSEGCTGYEVTADLDFTGSAWASGEGWEPIGAAATSAFASTFGGGAPTYTISNLFIDRPSTASAMGLFGYTAAGSAIRNVNLEGVDVTAVDYVGGLVGQSISQIDNSSVAGTVDGRWYVGGLAGLSDAAVTASTSSVNVTSSSTGGVTGGLVGLSRASITNSHASGTVSGAGWAGGLVGWSQGAISGSSASGAVTATGQTSGGLVGFNDGAPIEDSHASGAVNGVNYVGGLVGSSGNANSGDTIDRSTASGAVTGTGGDVGGLAGWNDDDIRDCFASGAVKSDGDRVGGLVGHNASGGWIYDSRAEGDVGEATSPSDSIGGLVGANDGGIAGSVASGAVTSTGDAVGGLVGKNQGRVRWGIASGDVSGGNQVGGLAGHSANPIMASRASGTVTASGDMAGGLVGRNWNAIGGSFATGGVTGVNSVGGLAGVHAGTITATYASGSVTGSGDAAGGLVGLAPKGATADAASSTTASYATGAVGGTGTNIGGFAGVVETATDTALIASFTDSYWDTSTSGRVIGVATDDADASGSIDGTETATAGVVGKTSTELQTPTGYSGIFEDWNVEISGPTAHASGPWDFGGTSDYPALRGPTNPPSFPSGTASASITEESVTGIAIGSPVTASASGGDTLSYKLVGAGAFHFSIDPETAQLQTKSYLDYENPSDANRDNTYEFMVQARVGETSAFLGKAVAFRKVSVQVTDATDNALPPTITGSAAVDFPENGTGAVATYTVNDPENAATAWLPLEGADRRRFEISSDGALSFLDPPDHERPRDAGGNNEYVVTIEASDGRFSAILEVTVTVTNVDEPPVIRGVDDIQTQENFAPFNAGFAARDPEGATTTFTWSLSGTDADDFDIDGAASTVTFKSVPDYEAPTDADGNNVYLVTVQADDGTSSELGTFGVMITVTGVDEPPVVSGPDSVEVAENSTAVIGSYSASDPEDEQVGQLQLSGADAGPFELSDAGVLSLVEELDYEDPRDVGEGNTYVVTIGALAGSLRGALDVTVTITGVNEAPTIRGHDQIMFQERSTTRCVFRYQAGDPEYDPTSWLSPSGTDGADFRINESGDLCFITAPDFDNPHDSNTDNVYLVTVTASDGSLTDTLDVTITVTGVDEPPDITGESNIEFAENGTETVDTYSASDPEGEEVSELSLSGDDSDEFDLSASGDLTFKNPPDYEAPADADRDNVYVVVVSADDGNKTGMRHVFVTITDENEAPLTPTGMAEITVAENTTGNLARYSATDPDEGDTVVWGVSGTDAGDFRIDSAGNLAFDGVPDYETPADSGGNNVYEIRVDAKDADFTSSYDVTVTVTPVDERPVITGVTTIGDYDENGTGDVATYTATDPEGDSNITWSLAGPDRGDFDITAGVLTFKEVPDHERPDDSGGNNQYEVVVQATDSSNNQGELHVDVIVSNVDELPELTGPATVDDFPENSAPSRQVGRYTATDPEGATVTLGLSSGGADFALASNGVLTFRQSPDYEEQGSYSVTVRAVAGSDTVDRVVTVNIQNVEEPGAISLSAVQPQTGTELTATLEDDDGPTGTTWQWYRASSRGSAGAAITNADSRLHTPDTGDVGSYLRVVASYDDGHGAGKSATAVSANRVQEAPPTPEPPVFPGDGDYGRSIRENTRVGANVGAPVTATDANNDRLTYSIAASDEFEIVESTGQLRTRVELDHEDQSSHNVTVTATDPGGLTHTVSVTIAVEDVDETPEVSGPGSLEFQEGTSTGAALATYTATDPDEKGIDLALTDADSEDFTLGSGGVLTFNQVPNFEEPADSNRDNRYQVAVEAREQGDGGSVGRLNITIRVANADEPGVVETDVVEPRVGQTVRLSVADEDGGVTVTEWKWERGEPNSPCGTVDSPTVTTWEAISGAGSGSYTPAAADQGHCIRATAFYNDRAGTGRTEQFLTPNSVEIGPFFTQATPAYRVPENTAEGRDIGRVQARHSNSGEALTYRLNGVHASYFTIDSNAQLKTGATPLDYETQPGREAVVEITAEDDSNRTATITATITVTDECTSAGEPPCAPGRPGVSSESVTSLRVTWSAPRTPSGTSITGYQLQYRESDGGGSWSPRIVAGTDRSHSIENLITGTTYEVQVRATNDSTQYGEWSQSGAGTPGFVPPPRPPSAPGPSPPPAPAVTEPGAPAIDAVDSGELALTVRWTAPTEDGGEAITSYDLRHIRSDAPDKADANWTVADGVWTGSGILEYTVSGLTESTEYDVQVRAVNSVGPGPWSATATGTPEAVPAPPQPADACVTALETLTDAVTLDGAWADSCPSTNRSGSHARYYSFTLEQETEVTIDLTSDQDTYLYLLEGAGRDGVQVASNDDVETGNTNSRIQETVAAGTYAIEATTYSSGVVGDFTLAISGPTDSATTPPDPTPSPGPTGPLRPQPTDDDCVETFGTLAEAAEAEGEWTSDCASTNRSGRYARFFTFTLEQGTEVTIELTSEEDTYLFLLEGSDKGAEFRTENDDIESGNTNSRIVETLESGTYTVEATTYSSGQTGQFTLSITVPMETAEPPVSPEDPCVAALGTLTGAVTENGSWADDCASTNRSGSYARYYNFTLSQETEVQVDLTSDADTYLFLLEGAGRDGAVAAENDDIVSGNTNSQIVATLAARTYTIEATTYSVGVTGDFTLSVTGPEGTASTDGCLHDLGTLSGTVTETGNWDSDCDSSNREGRYARFYTFTLESEAEVTINLTSEEDPYLYLLQGAGRDGAVAAENDDIVSGNTDSQVVATLTARTYTIEATTYEEGIAGEFTLSVVP